MLEPRELQKTNKNKYHCILYKQYHTQLIKMFCHPLITYASYNSMNNASPKFHMQLKILFFEMFMIF